MLCQYVFGSHRAVCCVGHAIIKNERTLSMQLHCPIPFRMLCADLYGPFVKNAGDRATLVRPQTRLPYTAAGRSGEKMRAVYDFEHEQRP